MPNYMFTPHKLGPFSRLKKKETVKLQSLFVHNYWMYLIRV